ncbi:hypothetical protein [Streptomyces eurythermus]
MSTIKVYEDKAGGVYLTRDDGPIWFVGPVAPDMEGNFEDDAQGWHEGGWEPNEVDGQEIVDSPDGLEHIATWTPEEGVQIERRQSGDVVAGAGGQAYLGIDED